MQILFHLMANTGCLPDKVVPQIPTNRMKGEDQETPRICTGHTLDDCLTGIGIPHFISSFLLSEIRQGEKRETRRRDNAPAVCRKGLLCRG